MMMLMMMMIVKLKLMVMVMVMGMMLVVMVVMGITVVWVAVGVVVMTMVLVSRVCWHFPEAFASALRWQFITCFAAHSDWTGTTRCWKIAPCEVSETAMNDWKWLGGINLPNCSVIEMKRVETNPAFSCRWAVTLTATCVLIVVSRWVVHQNSMCNGWNPNFQNFLQQVSQILHQDVQIRTFDTTPARWTSSCRGRCASTTGSIQTRAHDGTTDHAGQATDYHSCIVPGPAFVFFCVFWQVLVIGSHLSAVLEIYKMCITRVANVAVEFVVLQTATFENS